MISYHSSNEIAHDVVTTCPARVSAKNAHDVVIIEIQVLEVGGSPTR